MPAPAPRLPALPARGLGLCLLVGLLLRVLTWAAVDRLPIVQVPDVDAALYHQGARRIAAGDLGLGHAVLNMSPGYFYLLGLVYRVFGDGPVAFRVVQGALGLALVALLWSTARKLYGERAALFTGLLAAAYGPLAFFENVQLVDCVGATLHAALLWYGVVLLGTPAPGARLRSCALLGIIWGACAVLRPNALALALPVSWVVWRCRPADTAARLRGLALCGALGLATIAPVTARNYLVAGEAALLTAHGGLNIYVGNGAGAKGNFRVPAEVPAGRGPAEQFAAFHAAAERALGRRLSAREADAYWLDRTRQDVLAEPGRWLALMGKKLRLFWNGRELWDVYDYGFYARLDPTLAWSLQFAHLAPFAWLGTLLLLLSPRREPAERWVALFNVTGCAAIILVFVSARYRFAVLPGMLIAVVPCARWLASQLASRRAAATALAALSLVASVWWTWPIRTRGAPDEEYFKLGAGYHTLGALPDAERAYRACIALQPDHLRCRFNQATLAAQQGNPARAQALFRSLAERARVLHDDELAQAAERALQAPGPPPP